MVFFTYGNSLSTWAEAGLMGRELLLYKKMIKQGCKVTFVTYGDAGDYKYVDLLGGINIVPVYRFIKKSKNRWVNLIKSFFIPFDYRLKKIFSQADIYKTNQMSGAWVLLIAGKVCAKPIVIRCGYEMLRNLLRDEKKPLIWGIKAIFGYMLELIAYVIADKIIISNKSDRSYIKKLFPVKNSKLELLRNFIDTDHFCNSDTSFIGKNSRTALYVGRIEHRKNIENLIRGAVIANCTLDIVGKGENQRYFKQIAEDQNGIVNFLGMLDNRMLPDIIKKYNLFILPSFYENNPKTILEGMACARVVLGTNVEGIKELIEDRTSGFLCDTDSESIADTIQNIFNMPDEKLNSIALNARQFVVEECSIERVFKQEMDIFCELLS